MVVSIQREVERTPAHSHEQETDRDPHSAAGSGRAERGHRAERPSYPGGSTVRESHLPSRSRGLVTSSGRIVGLDDAGELGALAEADAA